MNGVLDEPVVSRNHLGEGVRLLVHTFFFLVVHVFLLDEIAIVVDSSTANLSGRTLQIVSVFFEFYPTFCV